jgi:hypothetical protein
VRTRASRAPRAQAHRDSKERRTWMGEGSPGGTEAAVRCFGAGAGQSPVPDPVVSGRSEGGGRSRERGCPAPGVYAQAPESRTTRAAAIQRPKQMCVELLLDKGEYKNAPHL